RDPLGRCGSRREWPSRARWRPRGERTGRRPVVRELRRVRVWTGSPSRPGPLREAEKQLVEPQPYDLAQFIAHHRLFGRFIVFEAAERGGEQLRRGASG